VLTCSNTRMEDVINWELCCICQEDNNDRFQTPTEQGFTSLERDLLGFKAIDVVPSGLKVSWAQLDEGQGIAVTLKAHSAKYHEVCRIYCSSSRLKRFTEKEDPGDQMSPKELRSSSEASATLEKSSCCFICGEQEHTLLSKQLCL